MIVTIILIADVDEITSNIFLSSFEDDTKMSHLSKNTEKLQMSAKSSIWKKKMKIT